MASNGATPPFTKQEDRMCMVVMSSGEYGNETFTYDSLDEALAGVRRLYETCLSLNDGVDRAISLCVGNPYNVDDAGE